MVVPSEAKILCLKLGSIHYNFCRELMLLQKVRGGTVVGLSSLS